MTRKFSGLHTVEESISLLLKPIASKNSKKYSFINNLIKNWSDIVEKKYIDYCQPKSITFEKGKQNSIKLTIIAFNSPVAFFLKNNSDILIERIASLYGNRSISKIYIKQEPQLIKKKDNKNQIISIDKEQFINKTIQNVADQDLKTTLTNLAKTIFTTPQ
jgi:hypothetical protein